MIRDRLTVGVLTPHSAAGPEVELPMMTRGRMAVILSRSGSPPEASRAPSRTAPPDHTALRASTEPAALDRAAESFATSTLDSIVHASTTTGYVIGHREEAILGQRLAQRFNVPAVASCGAAVDAMRLHGIEQVQLVHPPWFDDEFDELGATYFRRRGFDAVVTRAVGLARRPALVKPNDLIHWVTHHVAQKADAIFVAGNGLRAGETIEELERRTGCLVLTANQVLLWGILAATATTWDLSGHGRLLRAENVTSDAERAQAVPGLGDMDTSGRAST